jgi:hypothetical protein
VTFRKLLRISSKETVVSGKTVCRGFGLKA